MFNFPRVFLYCAILAVALVFSSSGRAVSGPGDGTSSASWEISNQSDKAAWITIYWSYKAEAGWHIMDQSGNRPRCVKKGGYWTAWSTPYNHPGLGPQIRFRAQFENGANCGGGEVANRQDQRDIGAYKDARYRVDLTGSNGGYNLSIKNN